MRQRSLRKVGLQLRVERKPGIVHQRIMHPRITQPLRRAKNRLRATGRPPKVSPRGKPPRNRLVQQKLMRRSQHQSLRLRMLQLRRTRPVRRVSRKQRAHRILRLRQRHRNRRGRLHQDRVLLGRPTRPRPSPLLGRVRRNRARPEPRLGRRRLPNQRSLPLRRRLSRKDTNLSSRFVEYHLASVQSLANFFLQAGQRHGVLIEARQWPRWFRAYTKVLVKA